MQTATEPYNQLLQNVVKEAILGTIKEAAEEALALQRMEIKEGLLENDKNNMTILLGLN